jgi:hypothetical protein
LALLHLEDPKESSPGSEEYANRLITRFNAGPLRYLAASDGVLFYKLDAQPAVTAVLNALNRIPPEPSSEALAKIARGIVDLIDGEVD